jgi:hypothetical protein
VIRVLVVNHAHTLVCGVHDIGVRIADCLRHSTQLEVTHLDVVDANGYRNALAIVEPDVVIVNYRPDLMPWVPDALRDTRYANRVTSFAVLHQYEEATADARAQAILADGFDHVLALDPLLRPTEPRLHAVGRPIPETVDYRTLDDVTDRAVSPYIGSFGFAFPHKGFVDVAREIAALDRPAVYNLHMPEAYFNGANGAPLYTDGILGEVAAAFGGNLDIRLMYTSDHLAERELVNRLAMNDVNCLLYHPGQPDAGLSSALDYLIAARRPMLLSEADMFRHASYPNITNSTNPDHERTDYPWIDGYAEWPRERLGDVLDHYDVYQQLADDLYSWHHGRLVADIERIVAAL